MVNTGQVRSTTNLCALRGLPYIAYPSSIWFFFFLLLSPPKGLSDFPFTFHFHALEKEMAVHSGVLAWRIPGTGEAGGLPSLGSHRVGHDWSDLAAKGFPGGSGSKESACNAGDLGSIPGLGRSPGEGNGNFLKYSCLEDSMDRRGWELLSMGLQRVRHDWVTFTFTTILNLET